MASPLYATDLSNLSNVLMIEAEYDYFDYLMICLPNIYGMLIFLVKLSAIREWITDFMTDLDIVNRQKTVFLRLQNI